MNEIQVFFIDDPRDVLDVIDDPVFSHVTHGGEVYELFEVISINREYVNHPLGWTHGVMARHVHTERTYFADLRVLNFCVDDSAVYEFC